MRTTFSVALLMGLALAQVGWNPWGDDPAPSADPSPIEEDPRPDECAADIVTIDVNIEAIEQDCLGKATQTSILQAQLNLTQGDIENLVEQNRENSIGLAGLETLDMMLSKPGVGLAPATGMIPALGDRIIGLTDSIGASDDLTMGDDETIARKLQRLTEELELIKSLMVRISEAQTACDAIEMTQTENAPKLVTITADATTDDSLAKAVADFDAFTTRLDVCFDDVKASGNIELAIEANEALNGENQMALADLKADIESQVVTNDFWTQNASAVDFDATSGTLDSFLVADGVPFEFWSYLNAVGENNGVLTSVALKNQGVILAESEKNSMLVQQPPPDRAFPVVYKGIGNGECMKIDFTSVVSLQNAMMDMNQHMWGVRTYSTDYVDQDFDTQCI